MPKRSVSKPRSPRRSSRRAGANLLSVENLETHSHKSPKFARFRTESTDSIFSDTSDDDGHKEGAPTGHDLVLNGFTLNGKKFVVPKTRDTLGMLMRLNEIPTLVTWFFMLLTIYVGLPEQLYGGYPVLDYFGKKSFPTWYLLSIAVFWRLMYNVFLGAVLDYQSKTGKLTHYVREVMNEKGSWRYKILSELLCKTIGYDSVEEKPAEFNAWVLNTQFVNVILPNDVCAFVVFGLRSSWLCEAASTEAIYTSLIPGISEAGLGPLFNGLVFVIGGILIFSGLHGKLLSHQIIGYYAWFWGDFFFKIDKTLKFDGIFEVFPHPMYTVGYAWMYGGALWSGSLQVLGLTMFSHLAQMGFLMYVENPHIQRTYGVEFEEKRSTHRENIFIIRNFDAFRASDWMMVIILTLYILTTVIAGGVLGIEPIVSEDFFLGNAIITTLMCRMALSFLLWKQGRTRFWTRNFLEKGKSRELAFDEWKRLQNLLESLPNISFAVLTWRLFQWPDPELVGQHPWSYCCGAMFVCMLVGVSYWSASSCYNALGDFGWFYGDFFLRQRTTIGEGYVARGIYRYFSHPDIIFGKMWLHAAALLCRSSDLAAVASITHALDFARLIVIEEPHMKKIYTRRIRRAGFKETLQKLKIR
jgi:phosphatidylethanolamine N-methyltransferase